VGTFCKMQHVAHVDDGPDLVFIRHFGQEDFILCDAIWQEGFVLFQDFGGAIVPK
jgi:hypothetical protein